MKPLSSSRPSVAPSCRHFFYPWQLFLLPLFNRLVIAMQRLALRVLVTPAHLPHQVPDCARMVTNFKELPDHLTDAIQCPIVSNVPKSICVFVQCLFQSFQLFVGQFPRAFRRTLGFFLLWLFSFLLPAVHRAVRDIENLGNFFSLSQARQARASVVLQVPRLFLFVSGTIYYTHRDIRSSKISKYRQYR